MHYVVVDWVVSDEGFYPNLPEDCSFMCLAGSSKDQDFGLFEVTCCSEAIYDNIKHNAVPHALSVLLESCRVYPPALANAVLKLNALGTLSKESFIKELERLLKDELGAQRFQPYLLARSLIQEVGYREEGEFVWVVAYRPEMTGREVTWVSYDYQVYSDAVKTFDLDPIWLEARFRERVTYA